MGYVFYLAFLKRSLVSRPNDVSTALDFLQLKRFCLVNCLLDICIIDDRDRLPSIVTIYLSHVLLSFL